MEKTTTIQDECSDFLIFLDEDNTKKEVYVNILELNPSYISFKTHHNNTIILPINRVLKIKRRGEVA